MYAAAARLSRAAALIAPDSEHKLARSFRARRTVVARLQAQARAHRDVTRPLVWFHAPSVGEGLQARPIIDALRAAHPSWQIAYTFFSPSAERFAHTVHADIVDYLPFDDRTDMTAVLDALRPSVLVFAKLDVWPTLVSCANQQGIPTAVISATLAEQSGRRGWWSRQLLTDAYASLNAVGAIDEQHAARLTALGVPKHVLQVTGDTRFDQVNARALQTTLMEPPLRVLVSSRPSFVVGSSWPADERVIFAAWPQVLAACTRAGSAKPQLIIAPHEPTAAHCEPITEWAHALSLRLVRWSTLFAPASTPDSVTGATPNQSMEGVDVLLVDQVGVLGDLYALAQVAFVGGGFHSAGLHSVIEPAAFGVPVIFGPQHQSSREASLMLDHRGAFTVRDSDELTNVLAALLIDESQRAAAGTAAASVVTRELGATDRSLKLIEQLVVQKTD